MQYCFKAFRDVGLRSHYVTIAAAYLYKKTTNLCSLFNLVLITLAEESFVV